MNRIIAAGCISLALTGSALAQELTMSPDDAVAYIVSPATGDVVSNPVTVVFGLRGMGVAPAGIEKANTGHHHLLIDTELPLMDEPIPANANHVHFGGGQTEVQLDLVPGEHSLQLLLGDVNHIPHDPPVYSEKVTVTVE
ncbi:MAG: DUF4399 domain-containing protein [Geminicoccaceae bacterium]